MKTYTAEEIEKAYAFLRSPDACHYACQDCDNPAPECVATREAAALINDAAIARNRAKPAPVAPLVACTDCGGAGLMYGEPTCPRCVGSGYEPTYYTDNAKP